MIKGNEPINPILELNSQGQLEDTSYGLTKREYFAGLAMQGLCSACDEEGVWSHDAKIVAGAAVKYADALLAELERTNESD